MSQMRTVLLVGVVGCTSLPIKEIPISSNPSTEISNLQGLRDEAKFQQVDVLSPSYFAAAEAALKKAESSRSNDDETKEILGHVALGRANLEKANEVAKLSRSTMTGVAEAREKALAAEAPRLFEKRFKNLDQILTNASSDLENNNSSRAEASREDLTKKYSDLELASIEEKSLGSALKTIDQAIKEGAEENSARTLVLANKSITDAKAYILANRNNKAEIAKYSDRANKSANHLLEVARQVKVTEKTDPETMVLRSESQQKEVESAKMGEASKESELNRLAVESGELTTRNRQLEAGQVSGEKLDNAKAKFEKGEADVYRDGNRLIIRMKSIALPSGKSTLSSRNFAQLAKVQEVIRDLGDSSVTIEGHTDTVGSQKANQELSNERARAIGDYLSANGLSDTEITTVGLGDSKPIAPNKSKEGRAQNRRVDVIVTPK